MYKIQKHFKNGLILGRFDPLHLGHCFLINSAKRICKTLHLCLCSTHDDTIHGNIRYRWLYEEYRKDILQKKIVLHHIKKEIYDARVENPNAPKIWAEEIKKILKTKVHAVFASEKYGKILSKHLGADFVAVDIHRDIIPISGKKIKKDPYSSWAYLPEIVKLDLVRIIALRSNNINSLKKCVQKLKASSYIPYSTRIASSGENFYVGDMAKSELLSARKTSTSLICVLAKADKKNYAELDLCENTFVLRDENKLDTYIQKIKNFLKTTQEWNRAHHEL